MTVSSKPTSSPLSRGCGAARAGVGARVVYVWECDAASRRRERSAGEMSQWESQMQSQLNSSYVLL